LQSVEEVKQKLSCAPSASDAQAPEGGTLKFSVMRFSARAKAAAAASHHA
jgi:hypothetical protein